MQNDDTPESPKVVSLRGGGPLPDPGAADPAVIGLLRDLLASAEAGELRCFIGTGFRADGARVSCWGGDHPSIYEMRGAIACLQDEYMARVMEGHAHD